MAKKRKTAKKSRKPQAQEKVPSLSRLAWAIFVLVLALFTLTNFDGVFVFDDLASLKDNDGVTKFSPFALGSWWEAAFGGPARLRPLSNLSFALQWWLFEDSVGPYHIVSNVLHAGFAVALFWMLLEVLQLHRPRWNDEPVSEKTLWILALEGALLWALHPVQTQAVTYIVQRMTVLGGGFYIVALACYFRARRTGDPRFYWGALGSFLVALGGKEIAATAPVLIMAYEFFVGPEEAPALRRRRYGLLALACIPPIALAGAYGAISDKHFALGQLPGRDFTMLDRIISAPRAYLRFLAMLVVPVGITLDYELNVSQSLTDPWTTIPAALIVLAILAAALRGRKRYPFLALCVLCFFAHLGPESTFLNLEFFYVHRLYLPSIFLLPLVPVGLNKLSAEGKIPAGAARAAMAAILVVFAAMTARQNRHWQSVVRLYEHNVAVQPGNSRLRSNLSLALLEQGRKDDALRHARLATEYDPESSAALTNRGLVLHLLGRVREAETYYRKALEYNPYESNALNNLGRIAEDRGEIDQAIEYYEKALEETADRVSTLNNLGLLYQNQKDFDRAAEYYRQALEEDPKSATVLSNLGLLNYGQGNREKARELYERALRLNPKFGNAHYNYGALLANAGDIEGGRKHLRLGCKYGDKGACSALQDLERQLNRGAP